MVCVNERANSVVKVSYCHAQTFCCVYFIVYKTERRYAYFVVCIAESLCLLFVCIAERSSDLCVGRPLLYREWDLNPHSHFWPKDFKSFVSTDSTIAASLRHARLHASREIGCKDTNLLRHLQIKTFSPTFLLAFLNRNYMPFYQFLFVVRLVLMMPTTRHTSI